MTKQPQTTGQRIRAARLAKSRKIYAKLITDSERIGARETPETMYTQAALAKASGCEQTTISKYEAGKIEPELLTLRRLAKALEVPLAKLIGE